ncbi:TonB-dependent siderophore receptor [Parasphingorhabdus sp.]|uniref:TonB-dependent siderophore receptor n=1 Tax=Parasphingorhabdus sp. TaxID=2709688 RepID=UPI0032638277
MTVLRFGISLTVLAYCSAASAQTPAEMGDSSVDDNVIVVTGTKQERYRIEDSGALTGFRLDYLELPRVVNVIPEQLILDQKITDLGEALRNTPGVTQSDGFGGTNDDFFIRGFRRNSVYRNGFRRQSNFKINLTNTEYVQVVRGPSSITYGQVEPGGLVDIVTKKPLAEQRIAGEVRYGDFDDLLFLADWSQPVTEDIGVRVVASTQDANSFRDFTEISRDTIAVSGRFDLSPSTRFDVSYEYRDEDRPLDRGTVTIATPEGRQIVNNVIDIPISRRFGEPFEIFESQFHFLEATLEQKLGDNWNVRLGAAYESSVANDLQARPRAVVILNADAPISNDGFFTVPVPPVELDAVFDDPSDLVFLARRTDGSRERDTEVLYLNGKITGEFSTGSIEHRIAVGGDYFDASSTRFFVATPTTNGVPVALGGNGPLFDLRNPIYGNLPDNVPTDSLPVLTSGSKAYGFYINDYIDLTDRLSVLLGLRFDGVTFNGDRELDAANAFSPQAAINYKLADNSSVFLSYSQAFEPNIFADPEQGVTAPFDPEDSEQFELGVKSEFFDGALQASGALYRIDKNNVLITENGILVLRDGQSSQGMELSLSGQPTDGMNIVAGYAYTDAEVRGGANDGNQPRNVAEHTFNLWASYEVQAGSLEGLGFGGGLFHSSDRYGDDANKWSLGSYTLVDLSLWYTVAVPALGDGKTVRIQVAAKNLFDKTYFSASGGNERVSIGLPQAFIGSLSFDF